MGVDPYCIKCYRAFGWTNSCDECDVFVLGKK